MKYFWSALIVILLALGIGGTVAFMRMHETKALPTARPDISITITEGRRWEEIAAKFDKAGIAKYADFQTIMKAHPEYEGTLFPDTYRFFPDTSAAEVIAALQKNYTARTATLSPSHDDLVLASIVEREALNDTDRPIIAGVYANRLKIGMVMGSDPTVQYAKDTLAYAKTSDQKAFIFWSEILRVDYQGVKSSFNTYLQTGLPPQPICNPGVKSIEAAQNPTTTGGYLFFGYKDGKLLLAKTLQQHEAQL